MFPIGPAIVERLIAARRRPPIVFDFDDAIFLPSVSEANKFIGAFKWPQKVASIIRSSDHVITGNEFLSAYARRFNSAVTTIPTSVDTEFFVPSHRAPGNGARPRTDEPIVGWIGSPTTGGYIRSLSNVLRRVRERHRFVLRVSGAGETFSIPGVTIQNEPWALAREVELFNTCDIGVYPLDDDEWSKGKWGFKAIEFMACGVPVVAAAVGVNREIIQDGVNGFLASTNDEWIEKIGRLLAEPDLRARFGAAGRRTIEERYSLAVNAPKLVATFREVLERSRVRSAAPRPASPVERHT